MRRPATRIAIVLIATAMTAVGMVGALSYARDYNVHRGFGTVVQFRRAGTGRLVMVAFFSPALRRSADYLVYLPPHYSAARRYPVYYLLHGMPGQPRVFVDIANMDVRLDNQLSLGHARPMILVYPDGRIGASTFSDSEWANTPSGNFESYVIDVMHNVDRHFATLPHRRDRVIAGFSAGGYGAINIALHHLADFANVEVWSGYFTQTHAGVFAHASRAALAANSPLDAVTHLTRRLAAYPLRAYLFAGRDDSSSRQMPSMARALRARGVRVAYRFYPGGHDWSVWYPRLNQMLDLASWDIGHPPRRPFIETVAAPLPRLARSPPALAPARRHRHRSSLRLIGVLLLALASAALINLGFVLQHRGRAQDLSAGRTSLIHALHNRAWLGGQALGWIGFGGQIVAVALAPLTLVQAFAAGSLAISVPVAARVVGQRVGWAQLVAVAIVAVSLASLPIGLGHRHGHLQPGALLMAALVAVLVAIALALRGRTLLQAIASGCLYGVADAAIKADALALRIHGPGALLSGWTILAALATFGGFLAFQAALRGRDAVQPLSLMNAFTAVTAVGLGVGGFGESLGAGVMASIAHLIAIALVLACVRPLTRAQEHLMHADEPAVATSVEVAPRAPRARAADRAGGRRAAGRAVLARATATSSGATVAVVIGALSGVGLLYSLRELHWLAIGPSVPDALPLLQLAGFAGQPFVRVLAAWVPAGIVLGVALSRFPAARRALLILLSGAVLLLLASDASYALARNLRLGNVLLNREPGLGPWLECLLLAAGSALPGAWTWHRRATTPGRLSASSAIPMRPVMSRRWWLIAAGACACALAALMIGAQLTHTDVGYANSGRAADPPATGVTRVTRDLPGRRPAVPGSGPSARLIRTVDRNGGRLMTVDFYSRALGREAEYLVFLPAGYSPSRRLPVFYGLHGMPGRPLAFTVDADIEPRLELLIAEGRVPPMILVFPDGRIDGRIDSDSEWANTPSGRFESYVVDVVHDVDHRFATLPYRQDRVIAGLSAGAYGAANVGLHQIGLFGAIQVWSGYFTETHNGVFANATPATMAYNSPIDYVRTMRQALRRDPLRAFIYTGTVDGDRGQTPPMAAALRAEGADAQSAIYDGGHSWDLWSPRASQMLILAGYDFEHPLATPHAAGHRPRGRRDNALMRARRVSRAQ